MKYSRSFGFALSTQLGGEDIPLFGRQSKPVEATIFKHLTIASVVLFLVAAAIPLQLLAGSRDQAVQYKVTAAIVGFSCLFLFPIGFFIYSKCLRLASLIAIKQGRGARNKSSEPKVRLRYTVARSVGVLYAIEIDPRLLSQTKIGNLVRLNVYRPFS